MNLTDLQIELKSIEEYIAVLQTEIEKMKPKTEEQRTIDFKQITILAENSTVVNEDIKKMSEQTKKLMFSSLSYIILKEENDLYDRILYLTRLAKGSEFNTSAEDIYKYGLEFEMKDINNLIQDIKEYRYTYIIEALIIVNISENASTDMLSIIADIASMMNLSKEELRVLGMVAKSVLIGNIDYILNMPVPNKNIWSGKLSNYISDEWIKNNRWLCGQLCIEKYIKSEILNPFLYLHTSDIENYVNEKPCALIERVQDCSIVKEGDVICTYKERVRKHQDKMTSVYKPFISSEERFAMNQDIDESNYNITEKTIEAPCNGVVFFINDTKHGESKKNDDKYILIYVVSYFDIYEKFCEWYKKYVKGII